MEACNIIIAGVGGQGIILASKVIAHCAFLEGFDVKENELHGMAQREGSVISHVRFGDKVHSPLIPRQQADFLIGMEELEGLRYVHYLKPEGRIILSKRIKKPTTVDLQKTPYPEEIPQQLRTMGFQVDLVNAVEIAKKAGSPKVENIVLLGVFSQYLPFPQTTWKEVIKEFVPVKTIEINMTAFDEGFKINQTHAVPTTAKV
jgi:indolepyruvate ferredoxin oxidoreductase beta subunit